MDDEIKVSVSCLVYNHEKYLRKCLDGFVMQKTNFKFEVLIHDDASTDGSADIIREYEKKYPEIIKPIYQQENQYSKRLPGGITGNYQLPRAKGKYFAECEGDDYWCDYYKLQKQFDALENNPDCKLCVHRTEVFDNRTGETIKVLPKLRRKTGVIKSEDFIPLVVGRYSFQTSSYFCDSKMFIEKNNLEYVKLSPTGDEAVMMYFGSQANVYYIDEVMSRYRRFVEGSWSMRYKKNVPIRLNNETKRKASLISFNEYTNYKYDDICKKEIRITQYHIDCLTDNFQGMIKCPDLLIKESKKTKIFVLIGCIFPNTVKKLRGNR